MLAVMGKNVKWRIFEKESAEEVFGPVMETDIGSLESEEITFWKMHTENTTQKELDWCIQNASGKTINNPAFWMNAHSKTACFRTWQNAGISIPKWHEFDSIRQFEENPIDPPYLVRVDSEISGRQSFWCDTKEKGRTAAKLLLNQQTRGITKKKFVVQYIDSDRPYNFSYRIIVAGGRVIVGYARVSLKNEWVSIAGKFCEELKDDWVQCNIECERFCEYNSRTIVAAAKATGLNFIGLDVIFDGFGKPYFLEVQPHFCTGYEDPSYGFIAPYYNPSYPNLVKFLQENELELKKKIPNYYRAWLDKKTLFTECFQSLREVV